MNFINPAVLTGLAAASIPLILHLLNLRRLKTVEFSTLRFLKELQKTKIRRLKLKQILLLILRTLIIFFIVMAFARPVIEGSLPLAGQYAKTSAIILIDNSFSNDMSDEFGNRFNQAKNAAVSILDGLKDGDEAAIIKMTDIDDELNYSYTRNLDFLKEDFSKITVSGKRADLEQSLRLAALVSEDAMNLNREIYIISDAQKNVFMRELNDSLQLFDETVSIYFIQPGYDTKSEIMNISVDSLNVLNRIFQADKQVEAEVILRNNSAKDAGAVLISMFFNGDRVSQRTIDIPAGETRALTIAAAPQETGIIKASVQLEEDALLADNSRYFAFMIPDKPKVAVIGGAEQLAFIKLALKTEIGGKSPAQVAYVDVSKFAGINPKKYDIIICAGGSYLKSDLLRLEAYVKDGGAALIFADKRTPEKVFNEAIARLGFGTLKYAEYPANLPAAFTSTDRVHPLFEGVFKGTTDSKKVVESPKIYKSLTCSGGQSIINTAAGSFMSESILGDGRILYIGVSPDLNWSSLPLTGLFPTLVYRSVIYLSSREGLGVSVQAGSQFRLTLPKRVAAGGNFKIIDPNGKEFFSEAAILPSGATLSFDNITDFGVYSVYTSADRPVAVFAVNPLPSESYQDILTRDDIREELNGRINEKASINFIDDINNISLDMERVKTGTELWQLFVALALLCAFAEMLIGRSSKSDVE
ncbi:MAG: BatA domain-containing protein [Candidatus Kapabacteria bacterium]|jgi:hypothetical protein|nr:BatA domain-containing protein [Candidatus Kapabacteria bacterium]